MALGEYVILWVFASLINGTQPDATAFRSRAQCEQVRLMIEGRMYQDGDTDGDQIAGACLPITVADPRVSVQ